MECERLAKGDIADRDYLIRAGWKCEGLNLPDHAFKWRDPQGGARGGSLHTLRGALRVQRKRDQERDARGAK